MFYIFKGGAGVSCNLLCAFMDPSYSRSIPFCIGGIPVQSKAFCPMMANRVLGHIEDIFRSLDILARLPEQVDPGAVLSLQELDTNYVLQHHRPPDAPVCGQYQSDGNPTIEVSARPQVGLPPFFCEATGYTLQGGRRLHPQQPVDGINKKRELSSYW